MTTTELDQDAEGTLAINNADVTIPVVTTISVTFQDQRDPVAALRRLIAQLNRLEAAGFVVEIGSGYVSINVEAPPDDEEDV